MNLVPAKKTKDVVIPVLPYRMLDIFSTVKFFSNIDLANGKQKKAIGHLGLLKIVGANSNGIFQGSKQLVDFKSGKVLLGKCPYSIARFYEVGYDGEGKSFKREQIIISRLSG